MKKPKRGKGSRGQQRGTPRAHVQKKRTARHPPPRPPMHEELASLVSLLDAWSAPPPKTPVPETPADMAEDLMDEAVECRSKARREALARQALQVYPDCVDAHVLLALDAPEPSQALLLVEQAVAAAERELGPRPFLEDVGSFWLVLETRPYMRARELLASYLWKLGERQAAIAHYQDMLRLNPNDNQGIRYILSSGLLEVEDHEALTRLLATYAEDGSAAWAYTPVLLAFRQKGPTAATDRALEKALRVNHFVPPYLLGRKSLPRQLPEFIRRGGESEAVEYVCLNKTPWAQTPGALEWLGQASGGGVLSSKHGGAELEDAELEGSEDSASGP